MPHFVAPETTVKLLRRRRVVVGEPAPAGGVARRPTGSLGGGGNSNRRRVLSHPRAEDRDKGEKDDPDGGVEPPTGTVRSEKGVNGPEANHTPKPDFGEGFHTLTSFAPFGVDLTSL